jgi:hypothetical protein
MLSTIFCCSCAKLPRTAPPPCIIRAEDIMRDDGSAAVRYRHSQFAVHVTARRAEQSERGAGTRVLLVMMRCRIRAVITEGRAATCAIEATRWQDVSNHLLSADPLSPPADAAPAKRKIRLRPTPALASGRFIHTGDFVPAFVADCAAAPAVSARLSPWGEVR